MSKRKIYKSVFLALLACVFVLFPRNDAQADENPTTGKWVEPQKAEKPTGNLKGENKLVVPNADMKAAEESEPKFRLYMPVIGGDAEIVAPLKTWKDFKEFLTFNSVTRTYINNFKATLTKELQQKGYVFAYIQIPEKMWDSGICMVIIDCGPLGDITVKGSKNYSAKQIIRSLQNQEGKFNYNTVYSDLFDLNAQADLKVDTRFHPSIRNGRRVVDAELQVEDKIPIHGSMELSNSGSKESNEIRLRTTLQHYNLTKHNDVLTVDWLTGGDIGETLNSFNGNYYIPFGYDWTFGAYVGYNQSEYDNVLPEIDVNGKGYYYGFQLSKIIKEDIRNRWQVTAGWNFAKTENRLGLSDDDIDKRAVATSMPFVTLGYSSKVFDSYYGRNYASVTLTKNFAGKYGSSESEVFTTDDNLNCDGDCFLTKIQLARLQKLYSSDQNAPGKWTLFAKADAQIADGTVPSSIRSYLGGFNSVRGYSESEIGGDDSFVATLELRTPLLENFIPKLKKDKKFGDVLKLGPKQEPIL